MKILYRNLLIFSALCLASILLVKGLFPMPKRFSIKEVILSPELRNSGLDLSQQIKSSQNFYEALLNSYYSVLDNEVGDHFRKEFMFSDSTQVSVLAFFSTVSEAYLEFQTSDSNLLYVHSTKYPVQMTIFGGLGAPNSSIQLNTPYREAIDAYKQADPAVIVGPDQNIYIDGLTLNTLFPKWFGFGPKGVCILSEFTAQLRKENYIQSHYEIKKLGILTGDRDFSQIDGGQIGQHLAHNEILRLITKSQHFREYLTHSKLNPKVNEIIGKVSRSEKDSSFDYPLWEVKKDIAELRKMAVEMNLDVIYLDQLFKSKSQVPRDGYFLWYYSSHLEFMKQWILINSVLLFVVCSILFIEYKGKTLMDLSPEVLRKTFFPFSIVVAANAYILTKLPPNLNITYWIIPAILFVLSFIVTWLSCKT